MYVLADVCFSKFCMHSGTRGAFLMENTLHSHWKLLVESVHTHNWKFQVNLSISALTPFPPLPPHQESYLSLANSLISSQSDPQNQSRLMEAFSLLTPPSLPLDSKRTSKITFRKNLEQFLPFVKGFLCYKWRHTRFIISCFLFYHYSNYLASYTIL